MREGKGGEGQERGGEGRGRGRVVVSLFGTTSAGGSKPLLSSSERYTAPVDGGWCPSGACEPPAHNTAPAPCRTGRGLSLYLGATRRQPERSRGGCTRPIWAGVGWSRMGVIMSMFKMNNMSKISPTDVSAMPSAEHATFVPPSTRLLALHTLVAPLHAREVAASYAMHMMRVLWQSSI